MTSTHNTTSLAVGESITVTVERMAHGGEGIALVDTQVLFIRGAFPGDTVEATVTHVKKNFARATVNTVVTPSAMRGPSRCEAAAHGAGCCDYADVSEEAETALKVSILKDQLQRVGKQTVLPDIETIELSPATGWRTRVRLGVNDQGFAGIRKTSSSHIVTDYVCSQNVPAVTAGIMGEGAHAFTPGAEIVSVVDDFGDRSVVEIKRAPRGRRRETFEKIVEGSGLVKQKVENTVFEFPATGFWQAHSEAAATYSQVIRSWIEQIRQDSHGEDTALVAWDLYGGVGAFVPALKKALGAGAAVYSVETSPHAAKVGKATFGSPSESGVHFVSGKVEKVVGGLPRPEVVVLDPPRTGAGNEVITDVAEQRPPVVLHIGCDPATFARDTRSWAENGYEMKRLCLVNAFPATHHMETIGLFVPRETHAPTEH